MRDRPAVSLPTNGFLSESIKHDAQYIINTELNNNLGKIFHPFKAIEHFYNTVDG
jgi:hypothetical protein